MPHALTHHRYSAKFRGEVKCEPDVLRYRVTCKSIEWQEQVPDGKLAHIQLVFVAEILYRGQVIGICDNLGAGFSSSEPPPGRVPQPHPAAMEV